MSVLSVWFHRVGDFLTNTLQKAPADQQGAISDAAGKAVAAAQAVEGVMPVLVKVVADAALEAVPGMNDYIPAFNTFLDALAAEILSRKTTAAPAPPSA